MSECYVAKGFIAHSWDEPTSTPTTEAQTAPIQVIASRNVRELLSLVGTLNTVTGSAQIVNLALQPEDALFPHTLADAEERTTRMTGTLSSTVASFTVEIRDENNNTLVAQPIILDTSSHPDDPDNPSKPEVYSFQELIPFPEGGASVVLRQGRLVLQRRTRSASLPQVRIISPRQGGRLGLGDVIRWTASDADGDVLVFNVLYSADGGDSWRALAMNVRGFEYRVSSLIDLPASTTGMIRIVANDGFNSAFAESTETFIVPTRPLQVSILSPRAEQELVVNDALILFGVVEHQQQGLFENNGALSYIWASDRDGVLGRSQEVTLKPHTLSIGQHRITLVVTDSEGQSGRASVEILVQREVERGPLAISVEAVAERSCADSNNSHSLMVRWDVVGGQLPALVQLNITGPDGTSSTLRNRPLRGEQLFQLSYPGGGEVRIEMVALDANQSRETALASVQLDSCDAVE